MSPETIYVAPLKLVQTTIADACVSHLVTLINDETVIDTPASIGPERHLRLAMNDICEPQPGLVIPCESHVSDLIRFALAWDRKAPLLIHCWAGISRSTAAAFITRNGRMMTAVEDIGRGKVAEEAEVFALSARLAA